MPMYEYKCIHCQAEDERLGGLDDNTALCVECGNLMLRLNDDAFRPYFEEPQEERPDREQKVA
ncbi:MAG: FmdB family zinc ribbon protein [Desulfobacca sp.]|uniref:FmdB family zinc ribbon protein n=1 Tax=Desulfobacca sp. TaxID=2067990 RepID=UPI004049A999